MPANSYRLDFYLWFRFNPSELSLNDVKEFEFVNGFPTKYEVNAGEGYLEYLLGRLHKNLRLPKISI